MVGVTILPRSEALDDHVTEVQKNENARKIGKQFMDLLTQVHA